MESKLGLKKFNTSRLRVQIILLIPIAAVLFVAIFIVLNSIGLDKAFLSPYDGLSGKVTDNKSLKLPETGSLNQTLTPTPSDNSEIISSLITSPTPSNTIKPTVKPTSKPTSIPNTPTQKPTVIPTTIVVDHSKPWEVATGCPLTTQNCVPCTTGSSCRFEPNKAYGFLGWSCQDNNPGNIRNASTNMATDSKNQMIIRNGGIPACGVRYDSRGGSYFVFPTYTAGIGALKAYIKGINNGEHSAYTNCGDCTLTFFFSKYSGDSGSYVDFVAGYIGEPVTQTLRYVVENKLDAFVEAIKIHEGFFTQ